MPRGDRTGPLGQGPMTGRGMGYCRGTGVAGFLTSRFGVGAGRGGGWGGGRGRGWRWRNVFHATGLTAAQRAAQGAAAAPAENAVPTMPAAPAAAQTAPERPPELAQLQQQADELARALDEIRQRIAAIQGQ